MRHEDVWYSCDGCGNRLNGIRQTGSYTEVRSVNTDAADPREQVNQLCALCWLKVDEILSAQKRLQEQSETYQHELRDAFSYRNPGFEG